MGVSMQKEQAYGALFVILGAILIPVYFIVFFAIELTLPLWLHRIAIELPVLLLVIIFLFVLIRIGWNMMTAPPAKSLQEQEVLMSKQEESAKK
jgi:uncharacterized protein (DUF983 family)